MPHFQDFATTKTWFETHVTLFGQPYTLDNDQAKAVFDHHKNTIVTARAGSGKTRVIVAKVAFLVATKQCRLSEIAVFMFNRTAAAEVNERIGAVEIDGVSLRDLNQGREIRIASTFHKFALDTVKRSGENPQIISESEHELLVKQSVRKVLQSENRKIAPPEYTEILRLANGFIARAGQKFAGESGLSELCGAVETYIARYEDNNEYQYKIYLHKTCLAAFQEYLLALNYPQIDFNILMSRATRILQESHSATNSALSKVKKLKYIMVDEYQDFSYLFFSIIMAMRSNCPEAHLFVVGDDWQAINRFAGSDVDYFINFQKYFPEDVINIPLNTNYRSAKRIVENANKYMLKNYNPKAEKAIPFSKKSGKIIRVNPQKTKFDNSDLYEDGLGDARYLMALANVCQKTQPVSNQPKSPFQYAEAARLLKTVLKIIKKHRKKSILLLHRHNFTSCIGVTLENFLQALEILLLEQKLLTTEQFQKQIRGMTMHKSKGLESEIVIILEANREMIMSSHPHATIFELFGDTLANEKADQQRLLYVAMTRAKERLYILSSDKKPPI